MAGTLLHIMFLVWLFSFFLKDFLVVFWVKDCVCQSMVLDPTVHSLKSMRVGDGRFVIGRSLF